MKRGRRHNQMNEIGRGRGIRETHMILDEDS